jgi:hypothetical protein
MRDDLHSYLLLILLQIFQVFNVCLNRVFEEFILVVFGQVVEPLQVRDTLYQASRSQSLDNLILISLSKCTPPLLT